MKFRYRTAALAAVASALAVAVPATAHQAASSHSAGTSQSSTHTQRCAAHKRAYIVSGTITDGSGMTLSSDGTGTGSLTYTLTHHNRYAKHDPGTATLSNVKVKFENGATDFSTGNQIKLIGKVKWVREKGHNTCTTSGPQGDPAFRMLVVSPAAS